MSKYISVKNIGNCENPLQWWKLNKNELPIMAVFARKYLSAPPSSIESERLFSVGGTIYSPKRNRMKGETSEVLIFLHYYQRILGHAYE